MADTRRADRRWWDAPAGGLLLAAATAAGMGGGSSNSLGVSTLASTFFDIGLGDEREGVIGVGHGPVVVFATREHQMT